MSITCPSNSLAAAVLRLGEVDLARIRMRPAPGTATAEDVASIRAQEKRLFELVDGILVEKVMGFRESLIAVFLARVLGDFVSRENLGLVVGADGMVRLSRDSVRIPDVAFIAWERLPDGKVPQQAVPELVPSLAIEVLSASNTPAEMTRKRNEYFAAGVQLVWEVDLDQRTVIVFTSPDTSVICDDQATLTAPTLLRDFEIQVADIFAELDRHPN